MEIAIAFGFTCQLVLLAFFAAHRWRPSAEAMIGRIVYGLGVVALVLAVSFGVAGQPWYLVLAFGLYATWTALGAWIDIVRPIPWRQPPRWPILLPYAALLIAALLAFWIPMWWVDRRLWVAFGVLYAAHTTLNILAHREAPKGGDTGWVR